MRLENKVSESLVENLLIELDTIISRIKNIRKTVEQTTNNYLIKRLLLEYKNLMIRLDEISSIANLLKEYTPSEKLSYSNLLSERCKRSKEGNFNNKNLFFT